jgi:uncharacterized membrane protein YeaQ/YmgE (transglycosylase-associated protein family)
MGLITYLIIVVILGLVMGGLARLALPGPDPMSLGMTILVGIAGSLLGGLVARLIFGGAGGLFAAFAGSFLIVYLIRRGRGGNLTHPGAGVRRRR